MHDISLTEYETRLLPPDALSFAEGVYLWRAFDQKGKRLLVTFPSPKTEEQWGLTAQGWAGHIPLSPDRAIHMLPRLPLLNLFRLWEYAYALGVYQLLDGLTAVTSLPEFYERVVLMLLVRVQQRERQGFYRAYQRVTAATPFVRGRIQLPTKTAEATPQLLCRYDEHTADVPENQILAHTLTQVARSRRCSPPVQTAVRRAARHLQSIATPQSFRPDECVARPYTRLNLDYRVMHALCRFLLEHHGPATTPGSQPMQPFLIHLPRLYELFVAEWLKIHLPAPWQIKVQESVTVGRDDELRFEIDMVLYDGDGNVHAVLDTKYKLPDKAANPDVSQVVTYAQAKDCRRAILVYPALLPKPLDVQMHQLHLRSLTFAVEGDLETAGQQFLADLLS
jgi:5-methylcytosine-specific restriction enzyme subunit McrC